MSKYIKSKSGRKCQLTGKSARKGWSYSFLRSHFNPTAKRRYKVNLQTIHSYDENGSPITLKVCTGVIKRYPAIKLGINSILEAKREKRLKGKRKQEMLRSLGLLPQEEN